jgi:peroxiredoxin
MNGERLMPRQPVPNLRVPLSGGGSWQFGERRPGHFTMVVFYRGLHCPICATYLKDLESKLDTFERNGVEAIAVSCDTQERAQETKRAWSLARLPIAYGLNVEHARGWGLYVSSGRGVTSTGVEEPQRFCEPGLFLVRPDLTLYYGAVQTMPFARPSFADLIKAVEFAIAKDYPARGEVV